MKPASVKRKLEALRRFCRWAHMTGKLHTNVAAELKLARAQRGTRPDYSPSRPRLYYVLQANPAALWHVATMPSCNSSYGPVAAQVLTEVGEIAGRQFL